MAILTTAIAMTLAEKLIGKLTQEIPDVANADDDDKPQQELLAEFLKALSENHQFGLESIATKTGLTPELVANVLTGIKALRNKSGSKNPRGLFGRIALHNIFGRQVGSEFAHFDRPKNTLEETSGEHSNTNTHALRYYIDELPLIQPDNTVDPELFTPIQADRNSLKLLRTAWESWSDVCDINIKEEDKATGNRKNANVIVGHGFLDSWPDNVLAIGDVGPPGGRQLNLIFNKKQTSWTCQKFLAAATHEIGHILGLDHIFNPNEGQLMNEFRQNGVYVPKTADIAKVQAIWGARA
jgi:hypothetical protein